MPIDYPPGFDPETTHVVTYVMPDGNLIAAGRMSAPPEIPPEATVLSLEDYDIAQAAWKAAKDARHELQREEEQAAALVHFQVLVLLMPEATARMVTGYTGPWPVLP